MRLGRRSGERDSGVEVRSRLDDCDNPLAR
jgi:hypothetical protein